MTGATPVKNHDVSPFALAEALDHCAKWWWGASLASKIVGFAIGTLFILLPSLIRAEVVASIVAGCTIVAELCMYRSDAVKTTAQQFRRKLDIQDGFGWVIPATEHSDLLLRCSASVKNRAKKRSMQEPYFASAEPAGPARALKNVSESAWWTKHLAEKMAIVCCIILAVTIIGAIIVLTVAIQTRAEHSTQANVSRIVTGFLVLLLSLGVIKLMISYNGLSKNSGISETAAERALQAKKIEQLEALRIMYDYHLTRALGPIIPTWIWKLYRNEFNETWQALRNKKR